MYGILRMGFVRLRLLRFTGLTKFKRQLVNLDNINLYVVSHFKSNYCTTKFQNKPYFNHAGAIFSDIAYRVFREEFVKIQFLHAITKDNIYHIMIEHKFRNRKICCKTCWRVRCPSVWFYIFRKRVCIKKQLFIEL